MSDLSAHYERFQSGTNQAWVHSPAYFDFWAEKMAAWVPGTQPKRIVDLGCGRGLITQRMSASLPDHEVLGVEPHLSEETAALNGVEWIRQDAMSFLNSQPASSCSAILGKQMIHHVASQDRPAFFEAVRRVLAPGSVFLILTMPPTIEYPMFVQARAAFERDQIDYEELRALFANTGFQLQESRETFVTEMTREAYFGAIRERFISDLRHFSDAEIEAGIREIEAQLPEGDRVTIQDPLIAFRGTVPVLAL